MRATAARPAISRRGERSHSTTGGTVETTAMRQPVALTGRFSRRRDRARNLLPFSVENESEFGWRTAFLHAFVSVEEGGVTWLPEPSSGSTTRRATASSLPRVVERT